MSIDLCGHHCLLLALINVDLCLNFIAILICMRDKYILLHKTDTKTDSIGCLSVNINVFRSNAFLRFCSIQSVLT